jgi:hypothetical protein
MDIVLDDHAIIELQDPIADDLVGLVAFSTDENDITRRCPGEGQFDSGFRSTWIA